MTDMDCFVLLNFVGLGWSYCFMGLPNNLVGIVNESFEYL